MSDSKEIQSSEKTSRAIAATSVLGEVGAMLDAMMSLAKDPTVDAAKFETIARVVKDTREDAKKEQFYTDKAAAMFEMPSIRKDSKIIIQGKNGQPDRVQGTFAKWSDMQRAIYPILHDHNLTLSHDVDHEGTVTLVTPVLQHRNGYVERGGQMALPLDTSGGKNNTQGAGSASSYGMRYSSVAMLGIRYEMNDDDGNLLALPDEPLNDQQARRVVEAEAAWAQSEEAFDNWWAGVAPIDRAWLIQTGRYTEITGRDGLPGTGRRLSAPEQKTEERSEKKPEMTAEEWTDQYEKDLEAAPSLDDLAAIQQRGKKAMDRLKASGLTALHERAVKAGSEAYGRLSGQTQEGEE